MEPAIILVTGSTDGIGKQTALDLARTGAAVIVHGRNPERVESTASRIREQTGNRRIYTCRADLSSLTQLHELSGDLHQRFDHIDVLINNAGVYCNRRQLSVDGFEMTFAVNHLAVYAVTLLLLDLLKAGTSRRIVTVSSEAHADDIDLNNLQGEDHYDGYGAYSLSKLCNILFTCEISDRLQGTGITANCLHPGVIHTKLLRAGWGSGGSPVTEGSKNSVYLATSPDLSNVSGKYFVNRKITRPPGIAGNIHIRKQLWDISQQLTGIYLNV